jgi:hypothetical protein
MGCSPRDILLNSAMSPANDFSGAVNKENLFPTNRYITPDSWFGHSIDNLAPPLAVWA